MCVSAKKANFSGTSVLAYGMEHPKLGSIIVSGYQNTAINEFDGPNALLLHYPGVGMTKQNFIDASNGKHIFRDMKEAVHPTPQDRGGATLGLRSLSKGVEIFSHGIYTVVLATDAQLIPKALKEVPKNKRPKVGASLCAFYTKHYPKWPVALCCFDNHDAKKADPLLVWYRPINEKVLVAPAVDSHTGEVPNLEEFVPVDHWVFFATDQMTRRRTGSEVSYSDKLTPELRGFLPKRVTGFHYRSSMKNGDFIAERKLIDYERSSAIHRLSPEVMNDAVRVG